LTDTGSSHVARFHPVSPGRSSRHGEFNTLPAVRGLEIGFHQLHQVIPALFPVRFRNREQQGVMDLGLNPSKNMRWHLQQCVADNLTGTVLTDQGGSLGELPTLLNPEPPTPFVHDVATSGFFPYPVLPTNENRECLIHPVNEGLSGGFREPASAGETLCPSSV